MEISFGFAFRHRCKITVCIHQILRHKHDQNRPHAIITEAFREFVAYDIRNAGRNFSRWNRGGSVWPSHKMYHIDFIFIAAQQADKNSEELLRTSHSEKNWFHIFVSACKTDQFSPVSVVSHCFFSQAKVCNNTLARSSGQ